jgi:hypothetical protein
MKQTSKAKGKGVRVGVRVGVRIFRVSRAKRINRTRKEKRIRGLSTLRSKFG